MRRRIALKRLSESDLTLFEYHYRKTPGAKQKAVNLDRSVFIDELYPSLPDILDIAQDRVALDLSIYGPGGADLENLQRKILKQQKNWRLNGELIYNPEENTNRYSRLNKGDLVLFEFFGEPSPSAMWMCLIGQKYTTDAALYEALHTRYSSLFTPHKAMLTVSVDDMADLLENIDLPADHPVYDLIDETALEDAVRGGLSGIRKLRRRRKTGAVGREEYERARRNAEHIGRLGEEILNGWFEDELANSRLQALVWESDTNAIAPLDFRITDAKGTKRSVDAKTTSGEFTNPIHISIAELAEMADSEQPYDLYRLYHVKEFTAKLRIAHDTRTFARELLVQLSNLPEGVTVDSVSVSPQTLDFEAERTITIRTDE